jgi:hypothetical protein
MFRFNVDVSAISNMVNRAETELLPAVTEAVKGLSFQTHAHILEKVQTSLHSSRETYVDSLHYTALSDNTFLIALDRKAWWIEDGIQPGTEMVDYLLRQADPSSKPPKMSKSGALYRVIPFLHSKGPTSQTPYQQELKETIRKELSNRGIPYAKLELDASGKPKIGKLHSFDIMNKPTKTHHGVGQGWGDIGKPRVGATGIPFLQGVTIYQNEYKTKQGETKVQRQIMTFRVVSSKHKGTGRWVHPGFEGKDFLKDGFEWAKQEWDTKIVPEILNQFAGNT